MPQKLDHTSDAYEAARAKRRAIATEMSDLIARNAADDPGVSERLDNLRVGLANATGVEADAHKAWSASMAASLADGTLSEERGTGFDNHRLAQRSSKAGRVPSLSFSEDLLKELQEAALGRRLKVASLDAPQSSISDFRPDDPVAVARDAARILALIPTETTTSSSVTYYRGTTAASAATAVAEGATKPQSTPTWAEVEARVVKIAHWAQVNDEVIADFIRWQEVVGGEMIAGLVEAENSQLLNGTGVAPNLLGLLNTPGIQNQPKGTDTVLDALFKGANKLRTGSSFVEPDVYVVNPADWEKAALAKNTQGDYIAGTPTTSGTRTLWGTPTVVTTRIAVGTALVANLAAAARAYIRQTPVLEVNPVGGSAEWKANITLVRAEERLALAVVRPTAIVTVTGLNV